MNYVYKVFSACKDFYNDINQATLTGAIDVVVVEQEDGSYTCSPFHVRFGKMGVLRSKEKKVDISINGDPIDLHMKLEDTGVAHFVEEVDEEVPIALSTSPVPDGFDLMARGIAQMKADDNFLSDQSPSVSIQIESSNMLSPSGAVIGSFSSHSHPFSDTEDMAGGKGDIETSGVYSDSEAVLSNRKHIYRQKSSETKSLLSSMFGRLVGGQQQQQQQQQQENKEADAGVTLSTLDRLDPKQVAQYGLVSSPPKSDESDSGTSSVYGSPLRDRTTGDETDARGLREEESSRWATVDMQLSLCGGLKGPDSKIPDDVFQRHLVSFSDFAEKPGLVSDPNLVIKLNGKYYVWDVIGPMMLSQFAFNKPLPEKRLNSLIKERMPQKRPWFRMPWRRQTSSTPAEVTVTTKRGNDSEDGGAPRGVFPLSSDEDFAVTDEEGGGSAKGKETTAPTPMQVASPPPRKNYKRSYFLTSDELKKLNLKRGANEVVFSVTTKYQGTARAVSTIYVWKCTDKVVISDIDGTITKSDVYGQILPFFGATWAQSGVAKLFTSIYENGYQFLYLSSRAIGQSRTTRGYLKKLKQGEISMPDGPLLLSPTSLFRAFHQEVIKKEPEVFKMAALKEIRKLFPDSVYPYHAGFGNKETDSTAYKGVGIPKSRIFIINPKGEVAHAQSCTLQTSYSKLLGDVDMIFPPCLHTGNDVEEQFNDFFYWKDTVPHLDVE